MPKTDFRVRWRRDTDRLWYWADFRRRRDACAFARDLEREIAAPGRPYVVELIGQQGLILSWGPTGPSPEVR